MITRRWLWLLPLLSLGFAVWDGATRKALDWTFEVPAHPDTTQEPPLFETVFDYMSPNGSAHSPAIRLRGAEVALLWFDGTRESHNDVEIYQSWLRKGNEGWSVSAPAPVLTRPGLAAVSVPKQAVLTLGNTIADSADPDVLFATVVSAGGWAASSIARVEMQADAPQRMQKLSLAPFLNRSHLVKSPTLRYADGTTAIPAYFELGNAFGVLARLDARGRVVDTRRLSQARFAIQPEIVVLGPHSALALMRNFDKGSDRLISARTEDGGQSWSPARLMALPNPNSPVAALRLSTGQILLAFNDSPTDASILRLALSSDEGESWVRIATLEDGGGAARYPMMRALADGSILLVYSSASKGGIRAHVFNEAWVLAQ